MICTKLRQMISPVGLLLLIIHTFMVWWIYQQQYEGSWGGFLVFVIDIPASFLFFLPISINQWLLFAIVGGIWWYLIGVFAAKACKWAWASIRRRTDT